MFIKRSIDETAIKAIPNSMNAKTSFESIVKRYVVSRKFEAGQLMQSLIHMKYDGVGGIKQHVFKMVTIAINLMASNVPCLIPFSFTVP